MTQSMADYDRRMALPIIGRFQGARWKWVREALDHLGKPQRIVDFGCYDMGLLRSISYTPTAYFGVDKNSFESRLDGYEKPATLQHIVFEDAAQLARDLPEADVAVALEVLYYLQGDEFFDLLKVFKSKCPAGLLVTVLNETGPFFLARHAVKKLGLVQADNLSKSYGWGQIVSQTAALSPSKSRNGRHCFSAQQLVEDLKKVYRSVEATGMPMGLPYKYDAFTALVCR